MSKATRVNLPSPDVRTRPTHRKQPPRMPQRPLVTHAPLLGSFEVDDSHIEVAQAKTKIAQILGSDVPERVQRSASIAMLEKRQRTFFDFGDTDVLEGETKPYLIEDLRIVRKLGEGSFGSVWKAENTRTGEKLALKKVLGKSFNEQSKFIKEAEILRLANHPNVLRFVGLFLKSGELHQDISDFPESLAAQSKDKKVTIYLCTEYCRGGDLKDFLISTAIRSLSWETRLRLSLDVARGLSHLHSHKVVHRDIKAENVLLKPVKKVDWQNVDKTILKYSTKTRRLKNRNKRGLGLKIGDEDTSARNKKTTWNVLRKKLSPIIHERAKKHRRESDLSSESSEYDSDDTNFKQESSSYLEELLNSRAILGDVGLARMFKASLSGKEKDEVQRMLNNERMTIRGTPWTMAPENIFNTSNYTTSSDIYSLGIVLLQISLRVRAEPPALPRRNDNLSPDFEAIMKLPVEPSSAESDTYKNSCPEDFRLLTQRCCNIDPLRRPNAKQCVKILEEIYRKYRTQGSLPVGSH